MGLGRVAGAGWAWWGGPGPRPAPPPSSDSSAASDSEASSDASLAHCAQSVLRSGRGGPGEPPGRPTLAWAEHDPPHERPPLTDRVRALAAKPGHECLLTARSSDLHPASWFAVAWYPLYSVPAATGRAERELGACFLTLHCFVPPGGAPGQPVPPSLGPVAALGRDPDPAKARAAAREAWLRHGLILLNPEWLASWTDRKP